ncbi:GAF domain-containing protein [Massilia sp. MB5]|uniref:GAF domain-containing protein n=1 Tax=unclassified Massilia TaxID=2609279 RepID=UPI00067DE78C|nr:MULTISPECIES: GAF domain-containing protein [unclassified Massilia]AKU24987.1 GAF sensor protein [Massilia sp. NR 4-1]UMR32054.1 GAF domain-containing protein [Massilia sp. MB5]
MNQTENLLIKLQDMSQFLASGSLSDNLNEQAAMTAALVGAETCSVMLLNEGDGDEMRMSVCASHGPLPPAALQVKVGRGEGIAGHVLASGRSLLVEDIANSQFAHLARRASDPRRSLMLAPIRIDAKVVGMLNASCSQAKASFSSVDLHLLDVIALFIGKSIQVQQLQSILNSRFTQLAMLQDVRGKVEDSGITAYQRPDQIARILAKSFFKEMTRAGFDSAQIVQAASEIITQLNSNLQRHSERAARREDGALH